LINIRRGARLIYKNTKRKDSIFFTRKSNKKHHNLYPHYKYQSKWVIQLILLESGSIAKYKKLKELLIK
jgi:hypothetical protein